MQARKPAAAVHHPGARNQEERDTANTRAERVGISVGALFRHAALNVDPPRAVRRPTVDHQACARLLAALRKIGSNINQLAHHAHLGRYRTDSIEMAIRDLCELRIAILRALGQEPEDPALGED